MSESFEEEMKRKEEEARKYIAKRKKGEKREIEVTIDTSSMEALVGKIKDLEPKAQGFKDLAQNLARKCRDVGLDVDSSQIKSAEDFKDTVQKLYQKKEENEGIPINLEKKGSDGQIPLSQQSGSGVREFSSQEEMFDSLRARTRSGSETERREAQLILDELFKKTLKGMKEIRGYKTSYEGQSSERDKLNKMFRKSRKKEEDENE